MNALDEIIARRKARCEDIENKIDKLDDELFKEYLELEFFENKKSMQVLTTFVGFVGEEFTKAQLSDIFDSKDYP